MRNLLTLILFNILFSSVCIAQSWELFNSSNSPIPFNSINALSIDNRGWLWIANENSGDCPHVGWFDGSAWNSYLTTDKVSDVASDNKGDVYFSTSAREILRYHFGGWFTQGSVLLSSANIEPLFCDKNNVLWLGKSGYYKALLKFDGKSWSEFSSQNSGFPGSSVTCLQDYKSNLWIGTDENGLLKLADTTFTSYNPDNSPLSSNKVSALANKNDTLWIFCDETLLAYSGSSITGKFSIISEFPGEIDVFEMAIDGRNNIWFTSNLGLVKYDRKSWKIYNSANSQMPECSLTSLVIDKTNNIWIGTGVNGLIRYNETRENDIDHENVNLNISCYPNPLDTKLNLNFYMTSAGKISVDLCYLDGKIILSENLGMAYPGNNHMLINLPELANGVYFLKLTTPAGTEVLKLNK